ncbi:MAG TPA: RDD family protein, partial [Burkholderiaceae bacterium]|nr:RDD family protein [Burkholderiaceae bacterium]
VAAGGVVLKIGLGVFGWVIYMLINGYFLAQSGQSLGKKALGIKIVRTDGSQPPLQHIVLRRLAPMYVAQVIPYIGPLLGLVDILLIFRSSRQCIHDQIADTLVVNV